MYKLHQGLGHTCSAHAIHDVAGEAEGHQLRCVQEAALLKGYPQVDVHHLSSLAVQQYVVAMPVSQPNDIPCIISYSSAAVSFLDICA